MKKCNQGKYPLEELRYLTLEDEARALTITDGIDPEIVLNSLESLERLKKNRAKRKKWLCVLGLAASFVISAFIGVLVGYMSSANAYHGDLTHAGDPAAVVIVTEKTNNYFIADVITANIPDLTNASKVKICVDGSSEYFAEFEKLQIGSKVRVGFYFDKSDMNSDGIYVIENLYSIDEIGAQNLT